MLTYKRENIKYWMETESYYHWKWVMRVKIQNPLRWSLPRLGNGLLDLPLWVSERPLLINLWSWRSCKGLAHTSLFTLGSEARPQLIPVILVLRNYCLRPPPPTSSGPGSWADPAHWLEQASKWSFLGTARACTSGWNAVRRNAIILMPLIGWD